MVQLAFLLDSKTRRFFFRKKKCHSLFCFCRRIELSHLFRATACYELSHFFVGFHERTIPTLQHTGKRADPSPTLRNFSSRTLVNLQKALEKIVNRLV